MKRTVALLIALLSSASAFAADFTSKTVVFEIGYDRQRLTETRYEFRDDGAVRAHLTFYFPGTGSDDYPEGTEKIVVPALSFSGSQILYTHADGRKTVCANVMAGKTWYGKGVSRISPTGDCWFGTETFSRTRGDWERTSETRLRTLLYVR